MCNGPVFIITGGLQNGVGLFSTGSFATSVIIVSLAINAKYFQKVGVICDQRVLIMCLLPQADLKGYDLLFLLLFGES